MMASNGEVSPTSPEPTAAPEAAPPVPVSPPAHGVIKSSPFLNTFDLILAAVLVVLAFGMSSFAVTNADFWRHAGVGRLIAQNQYEFGKAPFTYSGTDRYWTNHSWLYDFLTYQLYSSSSGQVVVITKAALVAILAFLLLLSRRTGQGGTWLGVLCVSLALLTSAPRLAMKPALVSYVLLGTIVYFLFCWPARRGSWKLPIAVGIVCGLWANCDQWYFLGPTAVALFLIGEFIQHRWRQSETDEKPDLIALTWTLAIAIAACMLNPHHFHVWSFPPELVSGQLASVLGTDPQFAGRFSALFDKRILDFDGSGGGNPVNAFAFVLLLALNVAGFVLNRSHYPISLLLLNAGMLVLAFVHGLALPFYAIVAAPTAAWNIGAFLSRMYGREYPLPTLRFLTVGRAGVRFLLLTAGLLALAACYPGWLQPLSLQRRLSWSVEPDAGFVRTAGALHKWRDDGQLPAEAHSLIFNMDLTDYCAWYAPAEKMYFDSRIGFHAPEAETFMRVKNSFAGSMPGSPRPPEIDEVFLREQNVTHVVFASRDRFDMIEKMLGMFIRNRLQRRSDWRLWDICGRGAIFGWLQQNVMSDVQFQKISFAVTVIARAFAADVQPLPDAEVYLPPETHGLLEKYLTPSRETSADTEEAWLISFFQHYLADRARDANRTAQIALAGSVYFPVARPVVRPSPDIYATVLVAIRSARRGVIDSPGAAAGYLGLAQTYNSTEWHGPGDDWKRSVIISNLARYFACLTPEQRAAPSKTLLEASNLLFASYLQEPTWPQSRVIWFDLALDALKQFAEALKHQSIGSDDEAKKRAFEQEIKQVDQEINRQEEHLLRQESLWLNAKDDPLRAIAAAVKGDERFFFFQPGIIIPIAGDRELAKVFLARHYGLHNKALETLKNIDLDRSDTRRFDQQVCSVLLQSQLLIIAGHPAEAELLILKFEDKRSEDLAKPEWSALRTALLWEKNKVFLVLGRFKELEDNLAHEAADIRTEMDQLLKDRRFRETLILYLFHDINRSGIAMTDILFNAHPRGVNLGKQFEYYSLMVRRLEDLQFRLAMIYLEQGDNSSAAFYFNEVAKMKMHQAPFSQFNLRLLGKH